MEGFIEGWSVMSVMIGLIVSGLSGLTILNTAVTDKPFSGDELFGFFTTTVMGFLWFLQGCFTLILIG